MNSEKIKLDVFKSYGIYNASIFEWTEIEHLGFPINNELCNFLYDLGEEIKEKEKIDDFYICNVGYFFKYYSLLQKYRKSFFCEQRNLLDEIESFLINKFGFEKENFENYEATMDFLDEWLSSDIAYIMPACIDFNLRKTIDTIFDYIDRCSPKIPKCFFDFESCRFILSFNLLESERAMFEPDFDWKEILGTLFDVKDEFRCKETQGNKYDSDVVQFVFPVTFFDFDDTKSIMIYFNGVRHEYDIDYIFRENEWRYYALRFCKVFLKTTSITPYEYAKHLAKYLDGIDEDAQEKVKNALPYLEMLHRQVLDFVKDERK